MQPLNHSGYRVAGAYELAYVGGRLVKRLRRKVRCGGCGREIDAVAIAPRSLTPAGLTARCVTCFGSRDVAKASPKRLSQCAAWTAKRRARRINATPPWVDEVHIHRIYRWAKLAQVVTGVAHHVDHIVPLQGRAVCGLHVADNLQIVPWWENLEKSAKFSFDGSRAHA